MVARELPRATSTRNKHAQQARATSTPNKLNTHAQHALSTPNMLLNPGLVRKDAKAPCPYLDVLS